jgi:hypothetical protein
MFDARASFLRKPATLTARSSARRLISVDARWSRERYGEEPYRGCGKRGFREQRLMRDDAQG